MSKTSTFLAILASAGVVGTAVATAKAVPKAQERIADEEEKVGRKFDTKEKIAVAWDCYVPPAAIGAGTIACVLGAEVLNVKQQASLISSYATLEQCYKQYRNSLIELHGPAADEEVLEHMAVRYRCDYHQTNIDIPDQRFRWYEPISKQWFEAYEREVMDAEYHFNRNYQLGFGYQTVNNLLYFLNLPDMGEEGDINGWCAEDEIYWIDFEHDEQTDADGIYYVVYTVFAPSNLEEYL